MLEIGKSLKDRREELGFSLKQMSEKTKVPVNKLQAIEDGNLSYFENDFTYLKFYIRYYCNALHLDFEIYRDLLDKALDEFSNTSKMIKLSEINEIQDRVKDRTMINKSSNRRKIDISFITFVSSITLLIITLILVFIFLILPNLNKKEEPLVVNPNIPTPIENTDEEETEVVEVPQVLTVSQIDDVNYEITGFNTNQELTMLINFKSNAYVRIRVDGDSPVNLPNKLYNVGTTLDFKFNALSNSVLEVYIGWMNGNTITINDIVVPINDDIASRNGSVTLKFKLVGDNS
ncbi:MAG TPA: helix-turn-helix domain-containing protein [Erysipelotrichaceae bacterium]|nr:helix-turn-helix domain-containing protein [Erysipelotrichaceae bacterium]